MDTIVLSAACLAFTAVITALVGFRTAAAVPRDEVLDRVRRATRRAVVANPVSARSGDDSFWAAILAPLSKLSRPKESDDVSRIKKNLAHAGFRGEHAVETFLGAKLALALLLAGGLLGVSSLRATAMADAHLYAVVLAAIGFYSPNVWLRRRIKSRQTALSRSLPDTLDLLVTCVEAGLGLDASLARINDEIDLSAPELSSELRQTTMEIQAGVVRADAFRRLADRTGLEELRSLSAMVIQTEMFGTGIARALRIHSSSMRTRRTHRAEEEGATVAVKMMLPLILCILPSLFAIIMGPAVVRIAEILLPAMGSGQ